jgi:2-oxoglutarate ferredoxin oxidoreductase subunit delta
MTETATARRPRGTVRVQEQICKGCSFCIEFCPTRCLDLSKEFNAKGYHFPVLARPLDCTGCGTCEVYCPDFAIRSFRLPAAGAASPAAAGTKEDA